MTADVGVREPAVVRQHLGVNRARTVGGYNLGVYQGWCRDVRMVFLPERGDEVVLWPAEDGNPATGVLWPVRRRRFASDGTPWLDLVDMRVDPDEQARAAMRLVPGTEQAWWTDSQGWDLHAGLIRGGWVLVYPFAQRCVAAGAHPPVAFPTEPAR